MFFNIILLGVVSFITDVSSELIHPILPMFITSLGGTVLVIGVIGGLRDAIGSILKVFSGFWADKSGKRKIFVGEGYFISSLFKIFLSFSKIWPHALIFSGAERIGKGLRTAPRDAIISDSMPERKGKGFGIHRALDTAGAIIGSAFCFILFWVFGFDFRQIIFLGAGIGFVALIPLYFVRDEKRELRKITLGIGLKELPREAKLFIIVATIFGLGNFSYMFFILRAHEFFEAKLAIGMPIILYVLFNIFYASGAIPFGTLSDKIGRKRVIAIGYILFVITCVGFIFSHSLASFVILFALYGLVYACIEGNQRAFISDLAPSDLKATALGTFHTSIGVIALPGSVIAGALWQLNPWITFSFGGGIGAVASSLLFTFPSKKPQIFSS